MIISGGGRPTAGSDVFDTDCSPFNKSEGERGNILSTDDDETPSGVVAEKEDNEDDEVLMLSSVVRDGNDPVGER